jgi:nucleoside-diphosphate-sugar epimerase
MKEINLYFKKPKIKKQKRDVADVLNTHGSNKKLKKIIGKFEYTNIKIGIKNLCEWYKSYYKLKI